MREVGRIEVRYVPSRKDAPPVDISNDEEDEDGEEEDVRKSGSESPRFLRDVTVVEVILRGDRSNEGNLIS